MNERSLDFFYLQFYRAKNIGIQRISIIVYVLIAVLSIDTVINIVSVVLGIPVSSSAGVGLFLVVVGTTIICQLYILQYVSRTSLAVRQRVRHINWMHKAVTVSQYFLILILVYVMVEIVSTESYSSFSSMLITAVSYMVSISLMGIFTMIFLSWYRSNRSSVLVLLYGLSFATVVIASVAILGAWMYVFSEQMPARIFPNTDVVYLQIEEGSNWKVLSKIYQYSALVSFFLKWGGTALILFHYSHKIGKAKYWLLLSLPVAYYSLVILYHFHIYEPHEELESLIFFGLSSLYATFAGILFYIAFKLTAKNFVGKEREMFRGYLLMAGFGFMVFFSASLGNVIGTGYPPFGYATVASYGLGSYLIVIGLYLSALSVSQDEQLRNMVKKSTLSESKFLHSIGTAAGEREKIMVENVLDKVKRRQEKIIKDIGIGTSLSEEDIRKYVREVEEKEEREEKE